MGVTDPEQRVIEGPQREYILEKMRSASGTALDDIRVGKSILQYGDRCMFSETLLTSVTRNYMPLGGRYCPEVEPEWDRRIDFLRMKYGLTSVKTDEDVLKEGKWFYLLAIYPGCPIN